MDNPLPTLRRLVDVLADQQSSRLAINLPGETTASHGQLAARIACFAGALRVLNADARQLRAAIVSEKCVDAYAAIVACVISGVTFCPLNLDAPGNRNSRILADFAPDLVFLGPGAEAAASPDLVALPRLAPQTCSATDVNQDVDPDRIAYVIYTSGTSGHPKGVQITYANLDWFLGAAIERLDLFERPIWSNHPNLAFDLSILDIFGSLLTEGTMVPVASAYARAFPGRSIADHSIEVWHSVPSIVESLRQTRAGETGLLRSLRRIILCGEPCRRSWVEYLLLHCAPDVKVFNAYGPTETTVFCSTEEVSRGYEFISGETTVPVGWPLHGAEIDLVTADGDQTQIVIAGPGIGPGYVRGRAGEVDGYRQTGTTRRFVTGDLAEEVGGKMFYRGRADSQVKLRGHRFELSEIEALLDSAGVPSAQVVAAEDKVVIFIDLTTPQRDEEIIEALRLELPSWALPSLILRLDAWPRNVNDKIDRSRLQQLARANLGIAECKK